MSDVYVTNIYILFCYTEYLVNEYFSWMLQTVSPIGLKWETEITSETNSFAILKIIENDQQRVWLEISLKSRQPSSHPKETNKRTKILDMLSLQNSRI